MAANMRCEKNSLALLSSKRTKAFSRSRADEAFALPSFSDPPAPSSGIKSPQRPEHCPVNVERMKQTMLQHESMFKEQLYELHRLYRVQQMLMEESKRKGSATHPRSDSMSSTSSLLYNPDSCKPKGETRFWDAKEAVNKSSPCKKLSFSDHQIDINKTHEDQSFLGRLVNAPFSRESHSQRVVIDLECPAEEHMEVEVVEEKPFISASSLKAGEYSQTWYANWQALQFNTPSAAECVDVRSVSMHRESLGNMRRSLEDCFTPPAVLPRHREVPFFPVAGTTKFQNSEANLCHVQTSPVTSLFGVKLNHESISRENQTQTEKNNLEERRKSPQLSSTDACSRSTSESSKLPHWLLQSSVSSSAKTSPVQPAPQNSARQHQTLPFVLQKHEERKADSNCSNRVSSVSLQELSSSWSRSGTGLHFGESFLRAPQGKPPSGCFVDTSRDNVQGFHKLAQAGSLNESVPFFSHARDERGGEGPRVPSMSYASSPTINKQYSSVFDIHSTSAPFFQDLGNSKGSNNGALTPSWSQHQKASSTLMSQLLMPGIPTQGSPHAFSANMQSTWPHSSVCENMDPSTFKKGYVDSGVENKRDDLRGSSPLFTTKAEVSSKRLIFGFMPTASDLELTLGLDLNASDTMETPNTAEGPFVSGNVTPRDRKTDLESKPMRNVFDLNEQSGEDLQACPPVKNHANFTGSKPDSECAKTFGLQTPASGDKPALYTSSNVNNKSEVTISSTVSSLWSANSSLTKVDTLGEALFAENAQATFANGGMWKLSEIPKGISANGSIFKVGIGSNGPSKMMNCESRSLPISVLPEARDGELCQSSEGKVSVQNESEAYSLNLPSTNAIEKLFEEASMMAEKQPRLFSGELGCLHVSQGGTFADLLVASCTRTKASVNSGDMDAIEAYDAADVLLHLGLDLQAVVIKDCDTDDQEKALKWLADIIPQEEISGIVAGMDNRPVWEDTFQASEHALGSVGAQDMELDSFELSVLGLQPINPDSENLCTPPIERWELTEDCSPHPNLRRRSQRRGKVGKDFQREMLPSMASLSRQEIAEDLQIIEGLVKSAAEAMARCLLSPKEEAPWLLPDLSSVKTSSKAKGSRSCKVGKQKGLLRVCSWGESTRRRRMRRQRSQWMSLPPGI